MISKAQFQLGGYTNSQKKALGYSKTCYSLDPNKLPENWCTVCYKY